MKKRKRSNSVDSSSIESFIGETEKKTKAPTRKFSLDIPENIYKKLKRDSLNNSVSVKKIVLSAISEKYS